METTFTCGPEPYDIMEQALASACFAMGASDHMIVWEYGERKDLRLDIYKDQDYNKELGEYNMVMIITTQKTPEGNMIHVDDTEDVYVGNGELEKELGRIYHYEGLGTI